MKKVIILLSVVWCLITTTKAQNSFKDKLPEERAKIQTEWMQQKLAIDSNAISVVHAINLKYANKMEELKNSSKNRHTKSQEIKLLSVEKDEELKTALTPCQYELYIIKKEEMESSLKQNIREEKKQKVLKRNSRKISKRLGYK